MTRIASLFAIALLAGCAALPNGAAPAADGGTVTLGLGQSTLLADNSLLTYTRLVNDSRCAPDVQCVWEGDAEIALQWRAAGGSTQDLRLHTSGKVGASTARAGDRRITLVALERGIAPKTSLRIDRAD
ncbi:hypothetical protein [Thermomonas sp. HDW16]|uniref:hypothetical protein n=1 Tax=Thermomonas sp. HDW16 TaxID=2714945 RepID=UPI00140DA443|nr:hypothetical protein [Thermomonas sp. HDW16]QIL21059.1 hypothetical protein G7079_10150 [Thermomonas sp. HDW16]